MTEEQSRKYTLCAPDNMSDKLEQAYNSLTDIDCNFSRLIQCLLDRILDTVKYISKQKKNFRHYTWHLLILDKDTGQCYTTCKTRVPVIKVNRRKASPE